MSTRIPVPGVRSSRFSFAAVVVSLIATPAVIASSSVPARAESDPTPMVIVFEESATVTNVVRASAVGDAARLLTPDLPGDGGAAVRVELTAADLGRVVRAAGVESVFADAPVAVSEYSWGLDRIDESVRVLDRSTLPRGLGESVDVYVVDTGVSPVAELSGLVEGRNFVRDIDGFDTSRTTDCHGHGTHVASLAAGGVHGVASAATVIPVRVLDCTGFGWYSDMIAALSWVGERHQPGDRAVVNMSIGGEYFPPMSSAIHALTDMGILVVVAAGNDGSDACHFSPSSAPSALTVAASDEQDRLAWFSNAGPCVDIVAPGTAMPASTPQGVEYFSGTSMAAPLVAGAAAAVWSANPWAAAASVSEAVLESATSEVLLGNVASSTADRLLRLDLSQLPAAAPEFGSAPGAGTTSPPSTGPAADASFSGFQAISSHRVADTRATGAPVAYSEVVVDLAKVQRPAGDAPVRAVALNVTVYDTVSGWGGGLVSVRPCGMPVSTSLLNFTSGETRAGLGSFAVPPSGFFCLFVYGTAHVTVDVVGWHVDNGAARFEVVAPARVVDSRAGLLLDRRLQDGTITRVDLRTALAAVGVNAAKVSAVWANLTVVDGTPVPSGGFIAAGPCPTVPGARLEPAITVDFQAGRLVANGGLLPVHDGAFCVFTRGSADLIVDVSGVETGASRRPPPFRLVDTRSTAGSDFTTGGEFVVGVPVEVPGSSLVVNVTALNADRSGWLTVAACERFQFDRGNVFFAPSTSTSNVTIVEVGASRRLCMFASAPVDVVLDVTATLG